MTLPRAPRHDHNPTGPGVQPDAASRLAPPQFVAASGKSHHAIVTFSGRSDSRVSGTVFEVTDSELASADQYEPAGYKRITARLASGKEAWVYADARSS